jgi:succinate dehydrogenase/fumarate reductase flavoprotein subunit
MSLTCDVLVVGGGGAALRAAIAACEARPGAEVLLVTKGTLGQSGVTATACSDRMAFHATLPDTAPGGADNWRYHADDIYRLGGYVSDADLAAVLARNAGTAFAYLDHLGVPWARRADGRVDQFVTDGSAYPRACYTGPYTANHIEAALVRRLRELPVRVLEQQMAAELILSPDGNRVAGAALIAQGSGVVTAVAAGAVVLATGGAGQIYAVNVFPPDCTGDGYALAYRAGAELVNLEFIQIGLCSLATGLACSGSMMRALPRLVNDAGEEFLPRYFPAGTPAAHIYETLFAKGASWPLSYDEPSHVIDIAVATEQAAGRRVFMDYARDPLGLDLAVLPERIRAWYSGAEGLAGGGATDTPLARLAAINRPSIAWLAERGVDLEAGDRVEIAPAVQHFQGGVKIGPDAGTTMAGLYAAGEVAGGQHGANRPGGNALMDSQVFGRIAGEAAAAAVIPAAVGAPLTDKSARAAVAGLLHGRLPAETVRRAVRQAMARWAGVYRTAAGLRALNAELDELAAAGPTAEGIEALDLLQAAQLVARAAAVRAESRGPHLRFPEGGALEPLPRDDPAWQRYIVLRRGADGQPAPALREPVRPGLKN